MTAKDQADSPNSPTSPAPDWPQLSCPEHGRALSRADSRLRCEAGHDFPIRGGIPRFVPETSYADHFGAQWNRYRTSQLDSCTGLEISRKRAEQAIGDDLWSRLGGCEILEVGCGAGRFTEVLLDQGARVTSVDVSDAVEANQKNFEGDENHRVVQADVRSLPFAPGQFDLVFCLGVIQHTPSPEETISKLLAQTRPGGALVFDHYLHNLSSYTKLSEPLLRRVLKRVPTKAGVAITEGLVAALLPLHRWASHVPWGQQVLSRVSPVRAYYHAYPQLSPEQQREWAMVDTHDALTSWYRHHRSPVALKRLVERLGAKSVEVSADNVFARIRAIK